MTRISDLGYSQILLQNFQKTQAAAQERQVQLSSGKISNVYSGVGAATNRLISSEGVLTRATAYENAGIVAMSRLQSQEAAMSNVADSIADLRARFVTTLSTGSADLILPEVETAATRIVAALNTRDGGIYVFGGVEGATAPVLASSLDDFGAAADVADLFAANLSRIRLPVEEGTTVDGGPTAIELAEALAGAFQDLANAESVYGPFSGELTNGQRAFFVDMVARLDAIAAELNTALGLNGVAQDQTDAAIARNGQRRDLAEIAVSEIEDIDIAEVVARLNQDQIAIEAAAQALAQATQLSLLNFI